MPNFLDLPRELRDAIYVEVIAGERALPVLNEPSWWFKFRQVLEPASVALGEYGCAYSLEKRPRTAADLLCCSRQINAEMHRVINMIKRKEGLKVKLDCIAESESFHYFTWLAIPLVKTTVGIRGEPQSILQRWADAVFKRYFGHFNWILRRDPLNCLQYTTRIEELWIDIRLFGDRSAKWVRNCSPPDRTSWAICSALKHILETGPELSKVEQQPGNVVIVQELVLNVVSPEKLPENKWLPEARPLDDVREGMVHPNTVARELVDVWTQIWSHRELKSVRCRVLTERVHQVRVCINGETWRIRQLATELKRGQTERRRIEARIGW